MAAPLTVVLLYAKQNRQSFNALAGSLENEPDLRLLFPTGVPALIETLRSETAREPRAVAGFSLATAQVPAAAALLRQLKGEFGARVFFVAGGPHPTADPAGTLRLGFDAVVRGEGEAVFRGLLRAVRTGASYSELPNLGYLDASGACRLTKTAPPLELDQFPAFSEKHLKMGAIEITRGCPYACGFCQTSHIFGGRVRHRSVENICTHLATMRRRGMWDVRFVTPDAFAYGSPDGRSVSLPRLTNLLERMRATMGLQGRLFFGTFPSEVRPEHVSPEALRLVRAFANNDNLVIGAQSGSERILKACHRGHTVAGVLEAVELILAAGFKANVDVILGLPDETGDDIEATIKLIRKLVSQGARIHAHSFLPLPQTRFANETARPLARRYRELLEHLVPKGHAYGVWEAQEKMAAAAANLPGNCAR